MKNNSSQQKIFSQASEIHDILGRFINSLYFSKEIYGELKKSSQYVIGIFYGLMENVIQLKNLNIQIKVRHFQLKFFHKRIESAKTFNKKYSKSPLKYEKV